MKAKTKLSIVLTVILTAYSSVLIAGMSSKKSDIVDTAIEAGKFKTLVTAVGHAGLAEALKGEGPFTVFAPTDKAFAQLPEGTLESLLKPENLKQLQSILKYHVVSGKVEARDVVKLSSAKTLQGNKVSIKTDDGKVMIDNANVIKTDIQCSNGVIHVIDQVIIPSEKLDIVDTAINAGSFKTLVAAVKHAELVGALKSEGPFTVFAPTDDAFAKLPEGTLESLLKPENIEQLQAILKYHVVAGKVMSTDVVNLSSASTLQGSDINIETKYGKVMIDNAKVIKADIECGNGVIHVIDSVILPKTEVSKNK